MVQRQDVEFAGGHVAPYLSRFEETSAAAREWFAGHLERGKRS
jgi:hypothetical protein